MLNNVVIPTKAGKSTEIDLLLIGNTGVYLVEVKTWKGSYSAYRDKWKVRQGKQWIPLDKSPEVLNVVTKLYIKKNIFPTSIDFSLKTPAYPTSEQNFFVPS